VVARHHQADIEDALAPGGGRDLEQLKAEVQTRVDGKRPPLGGIKPEDARTVLAQIGSLSREDWASAWSAVAERYFSQAQSLEARNSAAAAEHYWHAWRLHHYARWPVENTPLRRLAKQRALVAFRHYAGLLEPPIEVVRIPFEGKDIVAYLRLPPNVRPAPIVFAIAGLDSRKEDFSAHSDAYLTRGVGLFAVDLPGTGETPMAFATFESDRMFSAALDYLATRPDVDAGRIVIQGRSWSSYWAAKLAVTERSRLRGTVVHGGPIHGYFQPEWLRASLETGEYLYDYFQAKAQLVGVTTVEDLLDRNRRFSLLDAGLLDQPSAPMLVVNGARDSQIPIEDVYVLLQHGDAKEAWVNPAGGHMGRSPQWPNQAIFERVVMPWMLRQLVATGTVAKNRD
jgi:esterase FrsA